MAKSEDPGEAYTATMSQTEAPQRSRSKLGMEVLMWVSYVEWVCRRFMLTYALRRVCRLEYSEYSGDRDTSSMLTRCYNGEALVYRPACPLRSARVPPHNPDLFFSPRLTRSRDLRNPLLLGNLG